MLPSFAYVRPKTLPEAIRQAGKPKARIHAGGIDLLGCLRDRVFEADTVVSLGGLAELKGITATADGGLSIGALTPIAAVAGHPEIAARYPGLAQAAASVASPQLRNQGTIGGNLCQKPRCWYYRGEFHCLRKGGERCLAVNGDNRYHAILGGGPCFIVHPSDPAAALAALDATLLVSGPGGRRTVRADAFHMPPDRDPTRETVLEAGEVVTAVQLPPATPGLRSSYRKVRVRQAWDFALAGVALALRFDGDTVAGGRVVLSGAAPVPWQAREAEKAIRGRRLDPQTVAAAAAREMAAARPLSGNGYKVELFRGLIEEALLTLASS